MFCYTLVIETISIKSYEKVKCKKCGTQTRKLNLARRRKRCTVGRLSCTKCPNFSTTSQADLSYHIARKHPRVWAKNTYKCKTCLEDFFGSYALRKHRSSQHGLPKRTSSLHMDTLLEDIDDAELKVELISCNHLFVDSELEKGKHCVFNIALLSYSYSCVNENLDHVLNQLNCGAKVNLAVGFVLKNFEKALERVDTVLLRKSVRLWRGLNSCVPRMIWPTWKINCRTNLVLIFAQEKEWSLKGVFF